MQLATFLETDGGLKQFLNFGNSEKSSLSDAGLPINPLFHAQTDCKYQLKH